jgi:hypothetical protein
VAAGRQKQFWPILRADLQVPQFKLLFAGSTSVLLTVQTRAWKLETMARYSIFLGLQVEVQYRAGDILLPASGTFVGDTGRSIFLEQNLELRGQRRHFRWEIPYQYLVRLAEKTDSATPVIVEIPLASPSSSTEHAAQAASSHEERERSASAAAGGTSAFSMIFPRALPSSI